MIQSSNLRSSAKRNEQKNQKHEETFDCGDLIPWEEETMNG